MNDRDLRELAINLAAEEGNWTDCRPLFSEIEEALKEAGRFGPIIALDRIRDHLGRLEDERWESLSRESLAQVRMMQVYQAMVDLLASTAIQKFMARGKDEASFKMRGTVPTGPLDTEDL